MLSVSSSIRTVYVALAQMCTGKEFALLSCYIKRALTVAAGIFT